MVGEQNPAYLQNIEVINVNDSFLYIGHILCSLSNTCIIFRISCVLFF